MKRKVLSILLVMTFLLTGLLSGCGSTGNAPASDSENKTAANTNQAKEQDKGEKSGFRAVLLIAGTLGDKSFFDAANAGMKLAEEKLGAQIKVIEMGTDKTKYEPTFRDICAQDWDLIISGSPDMTEIFNQYCEESPDKTFINYDASNDTVAANLYSVAYAANELSYLSGAVAALCTTAEIEGMNKEAKIGFIGGMDIPGINDFLVGYIQGAKDVNPDIKVAISYAQDFGNPGKGKELAINQYDAGVDIIFGVAGGTGLGVLDAASEKKLYAVGVDSDQALLFKDTDAGKAARIITSAVKRIDQVVFHAIEHYGQGTLPVGKYEVLSFQADGIGITRNEYYEQIVPADVKAKIDEIEGKLVSGQIKVPTAIGMSPEELNQMRDSVN